MSPASFFLQPIIRWLTAEVRSQDMPLIDFHRLCEHVRPADVVLVEGRTRVAGVIQAVTLSSWTHSALYLGRLDELPDKALARDLQAQHGWRDDQQLLLEAEMGKGTHIVPLDDYAQCHLRICRPRNLLPEDNTKVRRYALAQLGRQYDIRQVVDFLRFFFPYGLLPRRWRSTLFEVGHGDFTRTVCSSLLAECFLSVRFPILPHIQRDAQGDYVFHRRNVRLFTPRDFDYSPYFDIIKYPFFGDADLPMYRELEWNLEGVPKQLPGRKQSETKS